MMKSSAAKIKLNSFDDLFGESKKINVEGIEQVVEIPLAKLHTFYNHPFKVLDDEKMMEMVKSVRENGILIPGVARKRPDGEYELIAGHRRKRASELAGRTTMPVFVREYTDDEAVVAMVDTNLQREYILPSEKAKAYSMKFEAVKHQGIKRNNGNSYDEIGREQGESGKTVQRYLSLAKLSDELLELVDLKKIGIVQGVNLSVLDEEQQQILLEVLNETKSVITMEQSIKIKEYAVSNELSVPVIRLILTDNRKKGRKVIIKAEHVEKYFDKDTTADEIENTILALLEEWKNREDR